MLWTMPAMESTSTLSGSCPESPSRMALSLPCPLPVAPSEPYSVTLMRATFSNNPESRRRTANWRAARIGPTVCELDGPMPILNRSKTLNATRHCSPGSGFLAGRQLSAQELEQFCRLDRLGEMQVEPGRHGACLVALLSPAGDRDQQRIAGARIEAHA